MPNNGVNILNAMLRMGIPFETAAFESNFPVLMFVISPNFTFFHSLMPRPPRFFVPLILRTSEDVMGIPLEQ